MPKEREPNLYTAISVNGVDMEKVYWGIEELLKPLHLGQMMRAVLDYDPQTQKMKAKYYLTDQQPQDTEPDYIMEDVDTDISEEEREEARKKVIYTISRNGADIEIRPANGDGSITIHGETELDYFISHLRGYIRTE